MPFLWMSVFIWVTDFSTWAQQMCWQMLHSISEKWQHATTFRPTKSLSAGCTGCFFLAACGRLWADLVTRTDWSSNLSNTVQCRAALSHSRLFRLAKRKTDGNCEEQPACSCRATNSTTVCFGKCLIDIWELIWGYNENKTENLASSLNSAGWDLLTYSQVGISLSCVRWKWKLWKRSREAVKLLRGAELWWLNTCACNGASQSSDIEH